MALIEGNTDGWRNSGETKAEQNNMDGHREEREGGMNGERL